jgi:hypothetical protein
MARAMTAARAFREVLTSAEKIKCDDSEVVQAVEPGDVIRQGDVYLVALDSKPKKAGAFAGRQLAPGDTQGSRHVAEGDCEIYQPEETDAIRILNRLIPETRGETQFLGPVIVAKGAVEITHPEHGNRTLPGEGQAYLVTYQRTGRDTIRRAED